MDLSLLACFLPSDLLLLFKLVNFKELGDLSSKKACFYIYLDERNILPIGLNSSDSESKGYHAQTFIQDFPISGKAIYLCIR
jgi:hypothetical protein